MCRRRTKREWLKQCRANMNCQTRFLRPGLGRGSDAPTMSAHAPRQQPRLNASLPQTLCRGQHLIAAGSHANVLGEVNPTHHSRRVHQELCGPGDVMPVRPAAHVQQIVTAYHLRVWIGKKSEGIACLPAQVARDLGRVHADRHRPDACRLKFGQVFLNPSQLEVAERSPIPAIENQQHRLRRDALRVAGCWCE